MQVDFTTLWSWKTLMHAQSFGIPKRRSGISRKKAFPLNLNLVQCQLTTKNIHTRWWIICIDIFSLNRDIYLNLFIDHKKKGKYSKRQVVSISRAGHHSWRHFPSASLSVASSLVLAKLIRVSANGELKRSWSVKSNKGHAPLAQETGKTYGEICCDDAMFNS